MRSKNYVATLPKDLLPLLLNFLGPTLTAQVLLLGEPGLKQKIKFTNDLGNVIGLNMEKITAGGMTLQIHDDSKLNQLRTIDSTVKKVNVVVIFANDQLQLKTQLDKFEPRPNLSILVAHAPDAKLNLAGTGVTGTLVVPNEGMDIPNFGAAIATQLNKNSETCRNTATALHQDRRPAAKPGCNVM